MNLGNVKWVSGSGIPVNGAVDKTVLAAQGSGTIIHVTKAIICVYLVATGGGGLVALEDGVGGTRLVNIDADAVGAYSFDFGEYGYPLTADTLLNATVDGGVTTQASANVVVTGWIAGA